MWVYLNLGFSVGFLNDLFGEGKIPSGYELNPLNLGAFEGLHESCSWVGP